MSKKAWAKLVVIAVTVIVFVVLIFLNSGARAELHFILWQGDFPLVLLMVILFGLGFVAGILTAFKITAKQEKAKGKK